ncbi:5'-nucleotidase C-terminal domain-containing protein [Pedobacter foliorum]|uniref:5'-nucleotidase C-terminal domain-containing protein n=1 Tax=Pedobacter foliorum TaxID=2739058 RepID=UPI001567BF25|nr:5'-nucleotidase [Pedobacter foliorum]NRF40057.1 5'-nucleotidase C-terminal domain-containing protein [Pedobacter foliorum]
MDYTKLFRNYLALSVVLLVASCSSGYKLVRANRAEYNVNKELAVDSSIIKTYLPYKVQLEADMNIVIGHSASRMSKKSSDTLPESLLSNFFSDAVLEQALKYDQDIDFALPATKGGLRVDFPKGNITVSNVFELMPFESQLVVFTLKGTDVQQILNYIASTNGQPVARLHMKIVDKKPVDVQVNGKTFDVTKTYRVLTSDYIGSGGDNVPAFKNAIEQKVIGLKVRDALMNYVKETEAEGKTINPKLDGRITKN